METDEFMRVAFASGRELTPREMRQLQPGDQLRLKVIEIREDQRALVDLGGFRALAEVSVPVRAGEELCVTVMDTHGQLRLKLARPADAESTAAMRLEPVASLSPGALSRLYALLERFLERAAAGPSGRLPADAATLTLDGLRQALEPLRLDSGGAAAALRLRAFCEDGGLFFEKRLQTALARENTVPAVGGASPAPERPVIAQILSADLKARLGAAKHLLAQPLGEHPGLHAGARAELTRAVDELLQAICRQQDQAVAAQKTADLFQVIHFCLPLKDGRNPARLKISYPRDRAPKARDGHRAALLLDLDRLGPIRIDLLLQDKGLSMAFFTQSERTRHVLEGQLGELRTAMTPWFEPLRLTVAVSRRRIAAFETEDRRPASARRLDVHA